MGGSEDGDGKGAKVYVVTGMIDGPGCVSTLILAVVRSTEEGGGELLLPEEDISAGLDVDVTEEDNDCGERVNGGRDKGAGDDDDGDAPGCVDGEDGGTAEARTAATRRTKIAKARINVQWGHCGPVGPVGDVRERVRRQRGEFLEERSLIWSGRGSVTKSV
jgi:hypothetical protein